MNTNKSTTGIDPKVKLSFRKIAVITGVMFIIATVTHFMAASLMPALTGTDYLIRFSAHANQVAAGALLYLIAHFACAGIAIVMYPVLKKWNAGLALGSVVFRTIETAFYMVGLVCLLSLLTTRPAVHVSTRCRSYVASGYRRFVGERTRPRRAGGGVRLLPGCIYVLLPVLPITAHSPMVVGLWYRRDHPDDGGLRVGLVQR